MDQLREQLLDAFRQQMEIRRSLMELENNNMEIQIDTSKHLLTIAESVFRFYTRHFLRSSWWIKSQYNSGKTWFVLFVS